jgi:hypothetical protein
MPVQQDDGTVDRVRVRILVSPIGSVTPII